MALKSFSAVLILWAAFAAAEVPPPIEGFYGPEFTFAFDGQSISDAKKHEYLMQLRRHLKLGQPTGAKFKEETSGFPLFRSPNGWWFEVTQDPGVLEIRMSPLSLNEWRRYENDIQSAVFVNAGIVGLFPWDFQGGGHINFDNRIFGNRIMLARNFLVDFWNNNELAMGVLNYDTHNAVPLALQDEEGIKAMVEVLDRAASGEWPDTEQGMFAFFNEVRTAQEYHGDRVGHGNRSKHHDLNMKHFGRIEIRSVRPQANMSVWLNQIELIESRINNHLRFIEKPLPLKSRVPMIANPDFASDNGHKLTPPLDPQKALAAFHRYVGESGLKWENHRGYVWPAWIRNGELEKFEKSQLFVEREILFAREHLRNACEEKLKP